MWKLVFLLMLVSPLSAQTLESFIQKALKHSPVLKGQTYKTNSSKEQYLKESIFKKNPVLSFSYQNVPLSSWPSLDQHGMSGINLMVSQNISFPWESSYRKDSLYNKYLSQKQKESDIKKGLIREITFVYHKLYFQYKKVEILRENKKALGDIVKVARALVSVNKMNSSQLLKIEADISIIENQILQSDAKLKKAQALMEKMCGISLPWQGASAKDWMVKSSAVKVVDELNIKQHPLYKTLSFRTKAQRAKLAYEKGKMFPGITLSGGYTLRQQVAGKDGEDFISFKASMPLPLYYPLKEKHSISAAESQVRALREDLRNIELMLKTSWQGEKESSKQLLKAYQNFEQEVIPKYFAAYKAQLGALSSGTVSLLDVLDAYRKYLNVSIKQAELYRNLQISIAKLEYLSSQAKENK